VGVVDDVKQQSLDAAAEPQMYVPISQMPYPGLTLVVRTAGDPQAALPALWRELRAASPALTVTGIRPMDDVLAESLARQRFSMTLIGVFAASALALAIVGLYGLVSLIVGQRDREFGVRLALGASPRALVRSVLMEGSRLGVAGVALGILAAVALTRVLGSQLYDVSATDTLTFVGAALLVLLVSLTAALGPARRAARTDPSTALRSS
jgi:ABC-type antimicrobial peptide transport system permease subunit